MSKFKAIALSLWYGLVLIIKWFIAKLVYPLPYLLKDWVYGNDVIKNYTTPKGVQENRLKWLLWLFLDDDQPTGFPSWYQADIKSDFIRAYLWSAWRNPAYNVNYNYLSKPSTIVSHEVAFGNYEWNRKLRASNGDSGVQFVWMNRADDRTTYLFSLAFTKIPFTMYYGWNADTNGRFTVALKFK